MLTVARYRASLLMLAVLLQGPSLRVIDAAVNAPSRRDAETFLRLIVENPTKASVAIRQVRCEGVKTVRLEGEVRVYLNAEPGSPPGGVRHLSRFEAIDSVVVAAQAKRAFGEWGILVKLIDSAHPLVPGKPLECRLITSIGETMFRVQVE